MSHFTVAVFTEDENQNIGELLEPFSEHLEVELYVSKTKDDLIQRECETMQMAFESHYQEWQKDRTAYEAKKNPDHIKYLQKLPDLMKRTAEEIYRDVIERYDEDEIDENGGILSTYNPKSKWDWYEIGGRWQGMLILKPGKTGQRGNPGLMTSMTENYDAAYVADLDFHAMRRKHLEEMAPYEKAMTGGFYKEEYMREKYPNEKDYVQRNSGFSTFAALTPDGTWRESGQMGYFGMSSSTPEDEREWEDNYYDRFIKPAITNGWYITIVDCHI